MAMSTLTKFDRLRDRCRARKKKCDGARPECRSCVERGEDCNYAAGPDASPTVALRRQLNALQQHTKDQEELVRLLATVSEPDAQQLLVRLRNGENVTSLVSAGREMRTTSDSSEATSSSSRLPIEDISQDSDVRHVEVNGTVSPSLSLRPAPVRAPAASLMVLEPAVDLTPNVPTLRTARYVETNTCRLAKTWYWCRSVCSPLSPRQGGNTKACRDKVTD